MDFQTILYKLNEKIEKPPYKFKMKIGPGFKHLHGSKAEKISEIYEKCWDEVEQKIKDDKMKVQYKHGWDIWGLWSYSDKIKLETIEKKYIKEWKQLKKEGMAEIEEPKGSMSSDHRMVVDFVKHQKKHGLKI